jgi:hypothetical protein
MKRVGIHAAGERLSGFTELGMNPTQALFIQKDTRAVGLVGQEIPRSSQPASVFHKHLGGHTVSRRPILSNDSLILGFRDLDLVLTATATATMAVPILKDRQAKTH